MEHPGQFDSIWNTSRIINYGFNCGLINESVYFGRIRSSFLQRNGKNYEIISVIRNLGTKFVLKVIETLLSITPDDTGTTSVTCLFLVTRNIWKTIMETCVAKRTDTI